MGVTTHRNKTKLSFPTGDHYKLANDAIIQVVSYTLLVSQDLYDPLIWWSPWTTYPRKSGFPGPSIL